MKRLMALLCAALLVCACAVCAAEGKGGEKRRGRYVAQIEVYGVIDEADSTYDHFGTLDAIDALIDDRDNAGLILLLDTPGGSIYEADELYHALMTYRELTGRPLYAYMERDCCSAGVYVAMAAEKIYAARMTLTGNVGIYMEETSYAALEEKFGVRVETVVSGENKLTAPEGLTDGQRAILQGIVDEEFGYFKDVISAARGEAVANDPEILDGRLLTAKQAQEKGLIDGLLYYDEAIELFYELGHFGDAQLSDATPSWPGDTLSGSQSGSEMSGTPAKEAARLLLDMLGGTDGE